jgi:hypothetical protein
VIWAIERRGVAQGKETLMDAKPSTVSCILRMFAASPASDDRSLRERDEDRAPTAAELERKLAERGESFFWTWQYPGQW